MARKVNEIVSEGIAQKLSLIGGEGFHVHAPVDEIKNGFMTKEDKATLNKRTSSATPATIMQRDSNGRAKVAAPVEASDIARKQEVDTVQQNLTNFINLPEAGVRDQSITTRKIKDFNVTPEKIANDAVVTSKIKNANVTIAKLSADAKNSENHTYSGKVPSATNVKQAIDLQQQRIDNIVSYGGDSNIEIVDARQPVDGSPFATLKARLDKSDENLLEVAVNIKLFGAVGDGVTDDTEAIKLAVETGRNIFVPTGNYLISDTIQLKAGQEYNGVGEASVHIFNFVDMNRDYFLINTPNTHIKNIKVTSNQTGDTYNSTAIIMRNGAVNCSISGTIVENVPSNAYGAEEIVDCEMRNIIARKPRRHGIYLIASDNIAVYSFYIYNSKLEPVVFRGRMNGNIKGYLIKDGVIDGSHEETTNWNAITLAQHPDQSTGSFYNYQEITVENVTVKNPYSGTGYGAFFYFNGEPLINSKFLNNTYYGPGGSSAFDFRKNANVEVMGNTCYNSFGSGITIIDSNNLTLDNNKIFNPVEGGNTNHAGILVSNSQDISITGAVIIDDRSSPKCQYGVRTIGQTSGVKVSKLNARGMINRNIDFGSMIDNRYGSFFSDLIFSANNLTNGTNGAIANGSGGSGVYLSPMSGYIRSLFVNVNEVPTAGRARFTLRHNGSTIITTATIDASSGSDALNFVPPTLYPIAAGDRISVVYYVENGWDKPSSDASIIVSMAFD